MSEPKSFKELLQGDKPPQQDIPLVRVCWDDLFAFLRDLLKPKLARPYANVKRHTTVGVEYEKVVEWALTEQYRGELEGVSLSCPNSGDYANTLWKLVVAEEIKFKDAYIGTALTLAFGGCGIYSGQKVTIWAKAAAGSIVADGAVYGREIMLLK